MFRWTLTATVEECTGIAVQPQCKYSLLMRFENTFSPPTHSAKIIGSRLLFNTATSLQFSTEGEELPSQSLQILLVCAASSRRDSENREDIIGMATIKIVFPLPPETQLLRVHRFDKSFNSKATIKASLALERAAISPSYGFSEDSLPSNALEEILSLQREEKQAYQTHLKFLQSQLDGEVTGDKGKWEEIVRERNELYKMSEDLYEQLRKCMAERDQYLQELREKELNEQQTKEELEFLKLKVEEYEGSQQETAFLLELEELRDENADLKKELLVKEAEGRELKRQVRESLLAIDEFRREAFEARSQLIHKESELSMVTRQSRYLDPYECIQELFQELQNRKLQQPFCFHSQIQAPEPAEQAAVRQLKRDIALFFTQLLQRMKLPKEKEWLLQQKVALGRRIDAVVDQ